MQVSPGIKQLQGNLEKNKSLQLNHKANLQDRVYRHRDRCGEGGSLWYKETGVGRQQV